MIFKIIFLNACLGDVYLCRLFIPLAITKVPLQTVLALKCILFDPFAMDFGNQVEPPYKPNKAFVKHNICRIDDPL